MLIAPASGRLAGGGTAFAAGRHGRQLRASRPAASSRCYMACRSAPPEFARRWRRSTSSPRRLQPLAQRAERRSRMPRRPPAAFAVLLRPGQLPLSRRRWRQRNGTNPCAPSHAASSGMARRLASVVPRNANACGSPPDPPSSGVAGKRPHTASARSHDVGATTPASSRSGVRAANRVTAWSSPRDSTRAEAIARRSLTSSRSARRKSRCIALRLHCLPRKSNSAPTRKCRHIDHRCAAVRTSPFDVNPPCAPPV